MEVWLLLALKLIPLLTQAGEDAGAFATKVVAIHEQDGGPTDADWEWLHGEEARLRA